MHAIGNLHYLLDLMAPKAPGRVAVSGAEGAGPRRSEWRRRRRAESQSVAPKAEGARRVPLKVHLTLVLS